MTKEKEHVEITFSLGVSQVDMSKELNIEAAALGRADKALYNAKN